MSRRLFLHPLLKVEQVMLFLQLETHFPMQCQQCLLMLFRVKIRLPMVVYPQKVALFPPFLPLTHLLQPMLLYLLQKVRYL